MKDKLLTIVIGITVGCATVIFSSWVQSKRDGTKEISQEIISLKEKKLDKLEFHDYMNDHKLQQSKDFENMQKYMDSKFEDNQEFLKMLFKKYDK